jgi:hypothetical protein
MSIRVDNLSKPDNKVWKKVSNFLLYALPVYLPITLALPLTEAQKLWINYGVTVFIITLKGISKFTSEDTI